MGLKFVYPGSFYEGGKMFFKHPMAAAVGDYSAIFFMKKFVCCLSTLFILNGKCENELESL